MELSYLLFTGSLSGLVSILGHSVAWSIVELARKRSPRMPDLQVQISEAFLHMLCGVALGLLFWLSWGLAAIVQVRWWVRGIAFGALAAMLVLPVLIDVFARRRLPPAILLALGSRWMTTCLVVGLSCAWSWENAN